MGGAYRNYGMKKMSGGGMSGAAARTGGLKEIMRNVNRCIWK